jgi:hypothetical protein
MKTESQRRLENAEEGGKDRDGNKRQVKISHGRKGEALWGINITTFVCKILRQPKK